MQARALHLSMPQQSQSQRRHHPLPSLSSTNAQSSHWIGAMPAGIMTAFEESLGQTATRNARGRAATPTGLMKTVGRRCGEQSCLIKGGILNRPLIRLRVSHRRQHLQIGSSVLCRPRVPLPHPALLRPLLPGGLQDGGQKALNR